jgi:hypothetical protein
MKTFINGTVGACLLLPIGAGAQAQPADPPITANLEPRFKLEALRFRALNETGIDVWPFSDEVYVTIHVPAHKVATISQVFGDVDAGETVHIPLDQSCILPIAGVSAPKLLLGNEGDRWSCSPHGAPGPFSFTVVFREKDPCGPWPGVWPVCFNPGSPPYGGEEPGPIEDTDDLIGRHEVVYSMWELIALQVGQVLEESVRLRPCIKPAPQGYYCAPWEAEYQFTWRITRLPDAEPVVGPISRLPDAEPVVGRTPF